MRYQLVVRAIGVIAISSVFVAGGCGDKRQGQEIAQAVKQWERPAIALAALDGQPDLKVSLSSELRVVDGRDGVLAGYVRRALERNPKIDAAAEAALAKLEEIAQVTSWPDPVVKALVRPEPIQTAVGDAYLTLGISQKIPWPGKLNAAGKAAVAAARAAVEQLDTVRLNVIADVERAYYRVYMADRSIELTAAHLQSLEDLEQVLSAQYRVGKAEQHDLLRIQTEMSKLRDEDSRYKRERLSAAAALNRLMEEQPGAPVPTTEILHGRDLEGDIADLMELAVEYSPRLAALDEMVRQARAKVALSDLRYWPDPVIGFEWTYVDPRGAFKPPINTQTGRRPKVSEKSEVGDDNWALMLQFNLPIWYERIEASRRQAQHVLKQRQLERSAAEDEIVYGVFEAWQQTLTHRDTVALLKSTLITQARQTYEVSLTSYQAGGASFISVIDNWRMLLRFELMLHHELASMEMAFSDLQREVGVQIIAGPDDSKRNEGSENP